MFSDVSGALVWFFTLELVGVVGLPWVFVLFPRLPDRGVAFAKPVGLLFLAYAVWVLGLAQVLPHTAWAVWGVLVVAGVGAVWVGWRCWGELRGFLLREWRGLLAAELVFVGMFGLWAFVVSGAAAISHTEKPMDLMLLNAAYQTRFFPAEDLWLSGHSISYYYFGHIVMAMLAKLAGAAPAAAYNLGVATVPALAGVVVFGLVGNLVRLAGGGWRAGLAWGGAGAALILLAGNLMGALELVRIRGWAGPGFWDWVAVKGLDAAPAVGGFFPQEFWWWFRSSRVIDTLSETGASLDYTITEFPAFSFVLGDLHAHVLAIPFVLLAAAAALHLYLWPEPLGLAWLRRRPGRAAGLLLPLALVGGALAFINFWDFPMFLALLAGALLLKGVRDFPGSFRDAVLSGGAVFIPALVLSAAMFAPFHFSAYSGQASGILPLREVATRPFLLFVVMGPFILLGVALLGRMFWRLMADGRGRAEPEDAPLAATALAVVGLPVAIWVVTAFLVAWVTDGAGAAFSELGRRLTLVGPGAVVVGAALFCALMLSRRGKEPAGVFALLLAALGFYLIMGAELFHIVDSFGGAHRRMNTVFKFYYQAWLLLGLAASFALFALFNARRMGDDGRVGGRRRGLGRRVGGRGGNRAAWAARWIGGAAVVLLLAASFYYTAGAIAGRSGEGYGGRTLDGLAFVRRSSPGEYAAIQWLRDEAPPGRIVEAVGDDYSDYGRISAATGRATVLGWKGHELQWRGSSRAFAGREEDVAAIYAGGDPAEARRLLERYGVRYVYLGGRERESYGVSELAEYGDLLKTVFRQDGVIVYEVLDPGSP